MPLRVPPKLGATCFAQPKGVLVAIAQPAVKRSWVSGPPSLSMLARPTASGSGTRLKKLFSLTTPSKPPSALAPLSPRMK
ncbi:MAG: hypothetical protein NZM40_01560 [Sphingomonadaceae bacterium]|nr:hypothetical protein [Sphingomonadaceae bacterium]